MKLKLKDIESLDRVYRINLINSITGSKPGNLIGTKSIDSIDNLAIFSSVVHLGSDPPLIGFFIRPQINRKSDTYRNIIDSGFFTINSISTSNILNAHLTSKKISPDLSEFDICSIEKTSINNFFAPFVKSSTIKIGLSLVETKTIYNACKLIVGKIEILNIDGNVIDSEGRVNLELINAVSISGRDTYSRISNPKTLPYVNSTFNIKDKLNEDKSSV